MERTNAVRQMQAAELAMLIEMDRICRENGLTYYLAKGSCLGAVRHQGFIPWDTDVDIMVDIVSYGEFCRTIREEIAGRYCLYSPATDPGYEELFARIAQRDTPHQGIHIDILPLVGAPPGAARQKLFCRIAYVIFRSYFVKKVNVNVNYRNRPGKKKAAILAKLALALFPAGLFAWLYRILSRLYPLERAATVYNLCSRFGSKELFPQEYFGEPVFLTFEGHRFPVPREWNHYLTRIYNDYKTPRRNNYA